MTKTESRFRFSFPPSWNSNNSISFPKPFAVKKVALSTKCLKTTMWWQVSAPPSQITFFMVQFGPWHKAQILAVNRESTLNPGDALVSGGWITQGCFTGVKDSGVQRLYFIHHAGYSGGKFLILYAHYRRVTQSLIESQKINALFSDKQLTQIPAWINLLLPLTAQPAVDPLRAKEKIWPGTVSLVQAWHFTYW